jgi:hypothetical protein
MGPGECGQGLELLIESRGLKRRLEGGFGLRPGSGGRLNPRVKSRGSWLASDGGFQH